jgi:hypothetical protein
MSMNSQPVFDVKGMVFVVVIKYAVDDKPHMILPPEKYDCKRVRRGVGKYQWWVISPTIRGLPACIIVTTVAGWWVIYIRGARDDGCDCECGCCTMSLPCAPRDNVARSASIIVEFPHDAVVSISMSVGQQVEVITTKGVLWRTVVRVEALAAEAA